MQTNSINLQGRVAAVTGGASGIGYAIAERFLASGAKVALWDFSEAGRDKALAALAGKGEVKGFSCNVADYASVEAATAATIAAFGKLDILVNSAGVAGPVKPAIEYSLKEWQDVVDINLNGTFYCCKATLPHMAKQDYGRIVNIASVAGKDGNPNASAYSATKAAVIGLTKSLGKEFAKTNVRVNCITPAAVRTPIFEQITQAHIDFMLSKIPMGRLGMPDEIAAMVAWLSSEECSFSTGAVFDLSGGRSTY
jgi:2-dehydro-3-deoxy-L-rhamnonate dehydrogenase (NAD+)